jgi:hypothetical protein
LFLYLNFPNSVPLLRYNAAGAEQVFELQALLETISSLQVELIRLRRFFELETTRYQTVPNQGSREGMEQLQIRCALPLLKWQHWCGLWSYHVEEASVYFFQTNAIY